MRRLALLLALAVASPAAADSLGSAVRAEDGRTAFSFPTRHATRVSIGHGGVRHECRTMTAVVDVRRGHVVALDLESCDWRDGDVPDVDADRDLGRVGTDEAGAFFVDLLGSTRGETAEHAVFGAYVTLGAEAAPALERVARDGDRDRDVREKAIFWIGQLEDPTSLTALTELFDDLRDHDLREKVIFALSQRPEEEALVALMRIASEDPDDLGDTALFWIGQSDHPRATEFLEELILR
jgi:HEAT repeat protein